MHMRRIMILLPQADPKICEAVLGSHMSCYRNYFTTIMTTSQGEGDWKVRINGGEEHAVPHAHVLFRDGSRVSIALDSFRILAGSVRPRRRLLPPLAWIMSHREELIAEYRRINR